MTAFGLFFALYGSQYNMGTAARMGPGYFPIVLGWLLTVLGLMVAIPAFWARGTTIKVEWSSLFWSIASLITLALTLYTVGVALATFIASLIALVPTKMTMRTRIIVSVSVSALTTVIFPMALQMQLPLWP